MAKNLGLEGSAAFLRSRHPNAFRSGQWARVVGVNMMSSDEHSPRACYRVEFEDHVRDSWPIDDPTAEYEFSDKPTA